MKKWEAESFSMVFNRHVGIIVSNEWSKSELLNEHSTHETLLNLVAKFQGTHHRERMISNWPVVAAIKHPNKVASV